MRLTSLEGRQSLLLIATAVAGALLYLGVTAWLLPQMLVWFGQSSQAPPVAIHDIWLGLVATVLLCVPLGLWLGHRSQRALARVGRALEGAVASYRDGDFSFSIAIDRRDELADLMRMHKIGRAHV